MTLLAIASGLPLKITWLILIRVFVYKIKHFLQDSSLTISILYMIPWWEKFCYVLRVSVRPGHLLE